MITIGKHIATIKENTLRCTPKGSTYVELLVEINEDVTDCKIWLTQKPLHSGLAQRQLAKCGFDYDKNDLSLLSEKPELLAGIKVPVTISDNEYNGQISMQCNIDLDTVNKEQLDKLQTLLRAKPVKGSKDKEKFEATDEDIPF